MALFKEPEEFYSRYKEIIKNQKIVIGDELKMADGKILERNYIPIFKDNTFKGHLWSFNDITLSRKYNESLEIEKQKYRNIIANMNLGFAEVDFDGKLASVNHSFTEICGYSEKELIGLKARDVFPVDKEYALEKTEETRQGKSDSFKLDIVDKNGNLKVVLISSAPNYNFQGEITGTIGIILDITRLEELEKQKLELLQNLEKSNNELKEYAHVVSHDLKSPLRSIFSLVSWIKEDNEGKLDTATLENFELIETTLEKMEQLITDILLYSSINSQVNEEKLIDLNFVIEDVNQLLFIPKHIHVTVLNKLPKIYGDRVRFQQLFQNLISNAVKFIDKEKGSIEIDMEENNTHYQFSVKDNGIGIEKKYNDKIFKIFHSLSDEKSTSGIGLSIVKKIIERYDGEIWLESALGKGTTFYFTIKK
ncbi:ATP-binding protein [uncultured Polaribacter sp.]|uniref:sensor histidine kinase n=1 Tax=uncultured Polaribacter sp. TaxID=174711 RepID=UPI002618EBAC|nr:PAS domain-containing sensor histidine kinase [uncultured Polaribacter sp.]